MADPAPASEPILRILAGVPKIRVQRMPGAASPPAIFPAEANSATGTDPWTLWLGPSEWLIYGGTNVEALRQSIATLVVSGSHLATDVSEGLDVLELAGPESMAILATGCGLDLAGGAVPVGGCAQSHVHAVPVIVHRAPGKETWRLFVDRSLSRFLRDWLCSRHAVRHL